MQFIVLKRGKGLVGVGGHEQVEDRYIPNISSISGEIVERSLDPDLYGIQDGETGMQVIYGRALAISLLRQWAIVNNKTHLHPL